MVTGEVLVSRGFSWACFQLEWLHILPSFWSFLQIQLKEVSEKYNQNYTRNQLQGMQ